MNAIPSHSNNSSMPVWLTIDEVVNIINRKMEASVTVSEVWRYVLYGHLKLSIYFQSPVKLQKICMDNNGEIHLEIIDKDIEYKVCYLNDFCIRYGDYQGVKTDGALISPIYHIIDTPLAGCEYTEVQRRLANSLNLPQPVSGQHNHHYGIFVREDGEIFQVFEQCTWQERISRQLNYLPVDMAVSLREQIAQKGIPRTGVDYFPLFHFPDDAFFVVKKTHLEKFIKTFFPSPVKSQENISTPLSRLLWLACKHNDQASPLIEHPYKLVSVFEEWATSDGITDRLSGDTLKKALKRGSPV
ncbi:hypothetical protein ODC56_004059 [Salmonella enterica]|nr:hypothetical protein [Salmonella enterica]EJW2001876.1 hypothetical protein [Salmonella enterica]EJW2035266.1 hypothetical protein [Salmonella enterica]EJW2039845.1 hypothetical protein [Salmonella enterica]EJW2068734.1 hypothetical protein [Salmonella enterica]